MEKYCFCSNSFYTNVKMTDKSWQLVLVEQKQKKKKKQTDFFIVTQLIGTFWQGKKIVEIT